MKPKLDPHPDRPPHTRLLFPVLCLSLGIAIGLLISNRSDPEPVPSQQLPQLTVSALDRSQPVPSAVAPQELSALDQLRAITAAGRDLEFTEAVLKIRKLPAADCESALALLRSVHHEFRQPLFDALARRWSEVDPYAAFSAAERERDNDIRNRLGYAAGAVLAGRDPDAAFARITNARGSWNREKFAEWILPAMAKTSPAEAAEYLVSNKLLTRHEHIYREFAEAYGSSSPREAIAWAESLSSERLRDQCLQSAWSGWIAASPASAAAAMNQSMDSTLRQRIAPQIARFWSRTDPLATLAWIESLTGREKEEASGAFEIDLQKIGIETARTIMGTVTSENARVHFGRVIAEQLADTSINEALEWADNLPEGRARTHASEPVINAWAQSDPEAATRYLLNSSEIIDQTELLQHTISRWADFEPETAFEFIKQLPPGTPRDFAVGAAINAMPPEKSQKAMELLKTIGNPEVLGRAAQSLIGTLVKTDPAAAVAVVAQVHPEGQKDAYYNLVRAWGFENSQAAGEWIHSLPGGTGRDSAIKAYVSVIDGMDPGLATQWAYSISDPIERAETTLRTFHRWIGTDRSSAADWLDGSDIPEGFRPFYERMLKDETYWKKMGD